LSWGSFLNFFAFKEGMLGTPISVLGGWPTVSGGFLRQFFITIRTLPFFSAANVALHLPLEVGAAQERRLEAVCLTRGYHRLRLRQDIWFARGKVNGHRHMFVDDQPLPLALAIHVRHAHREMDLLALLVGQHQVINSM